MISTASRVGTGNIVGVSTALCAGGPGGPAYYIEAALHSRALAIVFSIALLTLYCLLGGGKRIAKITGVLVPVMGVLYVLLALVALVLNIGNIPAMFGMIFRDAFNFKAIFGGFAWDMADIAQCILAFINIPVCVILGGVAYKTLDDYTAQKKAGKNPTFKAADVGVTEPTDFWN